MKDPLQASKCAELLKALAEPARLKIVQCLQAGPLSVSEVAQALDDELANASHHLNILRRAGFLESKKRGKNVIYSLSTMYRPASRASTLDVIDLGCCRLELGAVKSKPQPLASRKMPASHD